MSTNSAFIEKTRYRSGGSTESFPTRLGWWERTIYQPSRDDVEYVIEDRYSLRPDLLAYDVYGSPQYMWLILQYNNILDINLEFISGKTISLPTPTRVKIEMT